MCLQVSAVIVTDAPSTDTYKCRKAVELSIPVVSVDYIHDCIDQCRLLDFDDYIVVGRKRAEQLESGKISGKVELCSPPIWSGSLSHIGLLLMHHIDVIVTIVYLCVHPHAHMQRYIHISLSGLT